MENKKNINIRFSTIVFLLIVVLLVAAISYFVIENSKLQTAEYNYQVEVNQLHKKVEQLEQTIIENISNTNITSNTTTDNMISNNNTSNTTTNSNATKTSASSIEIGYDEVIILISGKPYIMPIHRPGSADVEADLAKKGSYYYNKFEIDNLKSDVKSTYAINLGTDPSTTIYFVMEDGSVKVLENLGTIPNIKYTSKEVLPASKNIVELKMEDGILNAITKDGNKIKIAESKA